MEGVQNANHVADVLEGYTLLNNDDAQMINERIDNNKIGETVVNDIDESKMHDDMNAVIDKYHAFLTDMLKFDAFEKSLSDVLKPLLECRDVVSLKMYWIRLRRFVFILYISYHKDNTMNFRVYNYDKVHELSKAHGDVLLFLPHNNPNVKMPLTYADGHAKAMNVLRSYSLHSEKKDIWPCQLLTDFPYMVDTVIMDLMCCIPKTDSFTYDIIHLRLIRNTRIHNDTILAFILHYFGLRILSENEYGMLIDKA